MSAKIRSGRDQFMTMEAAERGIVDLRLRSKMGAKSIAIVQSNYIPWKGYFDMIRSVDEFILYDDVQYTRRDWRNRNRIKSSHGAQWLTIPVEVKGKYLQKIKETRVSDRLWARNHWRTLCCCYGKAPCFREFKEPLEA